MLEFFFPFALTTEPAISLPNIDYLATDGIFGAITATSSYPKQGLCGWINGNYLFLVHLLCRTYDTMYGLGIGLFGLFKTQTAFMHKTLPFFASDRKVRLPIAEVRQFSHRQVHR